MSKEDIIIKAATRLFLKHGFGGTSMEAVARDAGAAKQTVYNYFDSKEALFKAIVRRRCAAVFDELPDDDGNQKNIEIYLLTLAQRVMDSLFTKETLELYRLVLAEAPRFPELGRTYYETGPGTAVQMLAAFFKNHGVDKEESPRLAEQFFGMLTGHLLTRVLLHKDYKLEREEKEKIIHSTVSVFKAILLK